MADTADMLAGAWVGGAGARILVVDDDPAIAEMLGEMLVTVGYAVHCCSQGDEALAVALAAPPDLVLLDIRMPGPEGAAGLDGLRIADLLAHDPRTCTVPVLLVTGVSRYEQGPWTDLLASRGRRVLFKPFTLTALQDAVTHILSGHS